MTAARTIAMANLAVIALAMAFYGGLSYVSPSGPADGTVTDDRTPVFSWDGTCGGCTLLLDDNPSFSSPLSFRVSGSSFSPGQELDFGRYFWKVRSGPFETLPMALEIVSTVSLSRLEAESVTNSGNTPVTLQSSGITGAVTLAVNETIEVSEEDDVIAEQEI